MENTQNNFIQAEEEMLSSKVVAEFTRVITDIIDDRIHKRLLQEDMIKVYDAEVVEYTTDEISRSYSSQISPTIYSNNGYVLTGINNISQTVTESVVSSITVKYDNEFNVVISNTSVKQIPVDYLSGTRRKWVKICTYDGVQFYVLHTL